MKVSAIVVAAGRGSRLGSGLSKALVLLSAKPLVIHSLLALSSFPGIKEIVVVVNPRNRDAVIKELERNCIQKVSAVVLGGARRQDSVRRGLDAVACDCDLVLIQDAARPFITLKLISALIKEAKVSGAAIAAVPVKNTIKEAVVCRSSLVVRGKPAVKKTLNRNLLWEAQTPQVFKKEIITEAYKKYGDKDVTDDAALVERSGRKVSLVRADYSNIKITTPDDIIIAEMIFLIKSKVKSKKAKLQGKSKKLNL